MELRVTQHGIRADEQRLRGMARRSRDLRPLKEQVRRSWAEAERRVLESHGASDGAPWPERKASTLARYRWPITHSRGGVPTIGVAATEGTGHFTGLMAHTLTHPHAAGIRADVAAAHGELRASFAIDPNGPIAHARLFSDGAGAQPPRNLIVWDALAAQQTADAATEHIQPQDDR